MIIISHRGNLEGSCPEENSPALIKKVAKEYLVEIDLWYINGQLSLGHDKPQYIIDPEFLEGNFKRLIIHAKNLEAAAKLYEERGLYHWFYHTDEKVIQTSRGWLWTYPGVHMKNGIEVITGPPDLPIPHVRGVCTDYPLKWAKV